MFDQPDSKGSFSLSGASEATAADAPRSPAQGRRVLFLDDDIRRAEIFLAICPEAVWVETAQACIDRLAEPWDEIHLDHDLGGERYVDVDREDCGMEVVRWLCAKPRPHLARARFFIHSHHLAAASLMVQCLIRAEYAAEFRPFGFDMVDLLAFEEISRSHGPTAAAISPRGRLARLRRRLAGWLARRRRGP